jgi:hypothetical protein
MKIVIRTVCFHFVCIVVFGFLYYYLKEDLAEKGHKPDEIKIIDFVLLSTTIQAGVGVSDLYPTNFYGKLAMTFQQLIMICTHVFTIYIFNV